MNENNLIVIPEDIREDIQVFGFLKLWKLIPISLSFILGMILFVFLPGAILFRIIVLFAVPIIISVFIAFDIKKNRKINKELKMVKNEGYSIQTVRIDSPFIYFQDGSIGMVIKVEPLPWELKTGQQKFLSSYAFGTVIRWANMNKAFLDIYADTDFDRADFVLREKEIQYEETLSDRPKVQELLLIRNEYHKGKSKIIGGETAYHIRIKMKASQEQLIDTVNEIIGQLQKSGAQAYIIGEESLERLNQYQMMPIGTSKPVYYESEKITDRIRDLTFMAKTKIKEIFNQIKKQQAEEKKKAILKHGNGRKLGGEGFEQNTLHLRKGR